MTSLYDNYLWLFNDCADDRVKDWSLMGGPGSMLSILFFYLYAVKVALPAYMKDRPAYSLKTIIRWYNVFQVVANSIVCYKIVTSGWTTNLTLGCEMPEFSYEPEPYSMLTWFWWTMALKVVELIETVFFVLRKKNNQVSFLHVYHHFSTPLIVWIGVKFAGGGMATFAPMINTFIHVIMYSYYLMSAEAGPAFRAVLNKYKKWLTIVQMAQFTIVLMHSAQALMPSCDAPLLIVWIFIPNVLVVYYLFYDFFKKSYQSKPKNLKK